MRNRLAGGYGSVLCREGARVHPAEVSAPRVYVGLFVRCVWLKVWLAVSDASWVASVIITLSARPERLSSDRAHVSHMS